MNNVKAKTDFLPWTSQGDVFRNIECIESVAEKHGIVEVSKIVFPLVVVLTQDCDLEQDARYRDSNARRPSTDDKKLLSVLVVPLYNAAHVFEGVHLADLDLTMEPISKNKTPGKTLMQTNSSKTSAAAMWWSFGSSIA